MTILAIAPICSCSISRDSGGSSSGGARVVEDDPALLARISDPGYRARPERAILFTLEAWDVNCSQHITARFTEDEVTEATAPLLEKIASLEAENVRLRAGALP